MPLRRLSLAFVHALGGLFLLAQFSVHAQIAPPQRETHRHNLGQNYSIGEDPDLRTAITREAEKAKQSITLKACERLENYEFAYLTPTKP